MCEYKSQVISKKISKVLLVSYSDLDIELLLSNTPCCKQAVTDPFFRTFFSFAGGSLTLVHENKDHK